jgi:hypothetical protein
MGRSFWKPSGCRRIFIAWIRGALLQSELPLEHSSTDAIVNEIQRRMDDEEFRVGFYEFATDVLGDDLRGEQESFGHWDVVEARYSSLPHRTPICPLYVS